MANPKSTLPLSVVARWDYVKPDDDTQPRYHVRIVGVTWDLSNKTSISLDYQEQIQVKCISIAPAKIYFAHFVTNF